MSNTNISDLKLDEKVRKFLDKIPSSMRKRLKEPIKFRPGFVENLK